MASRNIDYSKHVMVAPLYQRVEMVESRLARIEAAINAILHKTQVGSLDDFGKLHGPTADNSNLDTPKSGTREADTVVPVQSAGPKPGKAEVGNRRYIYQPLDSTKSEIRILCLRHQPNWERPIEAELVHISLDSDAATDVVHRGINLKWKASRQYRAMSYTWGEADQPSLIKIDGHDLYVTRSVESALRHMMASFPAQSIQTFWWIDQICINQADVEERNSQVALMRRIYKKAFHVHVWLGGAEGYGSMAMKVLEAIGPMLKRAPGERTPEYPSFSSDEKKRHWKAIDAFFKRPWWERSWIRQELALAKFVTVHCGTLTCQFEKITSAAKALVIVCNQLGYAIRTEDSKNDDSQGLSQYRHLELLSALRKRVGGGRYFAELIDLLIQMRSCQASDPRDKVFAVLGLVDPDVYGITADYRMTVEEVMMLAAKEVLPKQRGLDLLLACQHNGTSGQPSWMPNLFQDSEAQAFPPVPYALTPDIRFEDIVIFARGHQYGTIASISSAFVTSTSSLAALNDIYSTWQKDVARVLETCAPERPEKNFLESDLTGRARDAHWLGFISAQTEETRNNIRISPEGDFLAQSEKDIMAEYPLINFKLIKAYLLPDTFFETVHPKMKIFAAMRDFGVGRRLAFSDRAGVILAPADTQLGDSILLLQGASHPFIMRKGTGDQGSYKVVGQAFMMKGTYKTGDFEKDQYVRIV